MKISTKGRYATRIMARLALAHGQKPAQKKRIAEVEGMSADYVEQILMRLKSAGMVRSHRGVDGGFSLARDSASVTVADVLEAVEGPMALVPCQSGECRRASLCVTRIVWQRTGDAMRKVLAGITISDLARQVKEIESAQRLTFDI